MFSALYLIIDVNRRRFAFVKRLKTFKHFGKGWTRRIMGDKIGVQAGDIGVIDRSIMLHRGDRPDGIQKPKAPAPGSATDQDMGWLAVIFETIANIFETVLRRTDKGVA